MKTFAKYEKDCAKIKKANAELLIRFEEWLKSAGLSEKTIANHLSNIDFYINEYLLYEDAIEAKDGISDVGMYLGYWFIKKAMWASPASIKGNATSLNKFYSFMLVEGLIDAKKLIGLRRRIKQEMPEWLATLSRYDDLSIKDVW